MGTIGEAALETIKHAKQDNMARCKPKEVYNSDYESGRYKGGSGAKDRPGQEIEEETALVGRTYTPGWGRSGDTQQAHAY